MIKQLLSAATFSLALAGAANAAPVTVTSVTGDGTFNNSPDLLTDGDFGIGTWWTDPNNVWWINQEGSHGVVLTLAFDQLYHLTDANIGVGLPAEPVKSPMPGVSRTRNQVSSLISMFTMM